MKRSYVLVVAFWLGWALTAEAIPNVITYQGTLKQKNLPANGVYNLLFRITNQNGTQVYWSSGNLQTTVTNGLFSAPLAPSGVNWQGVTPYIEVSVEGQLLLPREPVTATVYALMSASVQDGSITPAKLDAVAFQAPGVGLIPAGAIMLFAGSCPPGWTRFGALDNRFPMGDPLYGGTGGSQTHAHGVSPDGSHDHGGRTVGVGPNNNSESGQGSPTMQGHSHPINTDGQHSHAGATGAVSSLPPYLGVVFCQKS